MIDEKWLKRVMESIRKALNDVMEKVKAFQKSAAKGLKTYVAIQSGNPKLVKLALHHPKARVRKKNLHRIIKEYDKRK